MKCENRKWKPIAYFSIKLWDSWQGDIGHNKGIGKLEASIRRSKIQVQGFRPQEPKILYESTEVKQKVSLIGIIFVKISL